MCDSIHLRSHCFKFENNHLSSMIYYFPYTLKCVCSISSYAIKSLWEVDLCKSLAKNYCHKVATAQDVSEPEDTCGNLCRRQITKVLDRIFCLIHKNNRNQATLLYSNLLTQRACILCQIKKESMIWKIANYSFFLVFISNFYVEN